MTKDNKQVVEVVIFKVKDVEIGTIAANGLVKDIQKFNNGIISATLNQSVTNPNQLTQIVVWRSLEVAKEALAASENLPHMKELMDVITEQVFLDHFHQLEA